MRALSVADLSKITKSHVVPDLFEVRLALECLLLRLCIWPSSAPTNSVCCIIGRSAITLSSTCSSIRSGEDCPWTGPTFELLKHASREPRLDTCRSWVEEGVRTSELTLGVCNQARGIARAAVPLHWAIVSLARPGLPSPHDA
jgi:hypothetical protein